MGNPLIQLKTRHLSGKTGGMFAVCSAHPAVLEAAMHLACERNQCLLIEATANQVNPDGGYTAMTPAAFVGYVHMLAGAAGLPEDQLIIGADHLGPHVWKHLPASAAMGKAVELARQCALAGFAKFHLDTGTGCADDGPGPLSLDTETARAAVLCQAIESAVAARRENDRPLYVVGDEVPPPGGGLESADGLAVTDVGNLLGSLDRFQDAFRRAGLESAWARVAAVVVQPGVEFGDQIIAGYHRENAAALSAGHARLPGIMTFEIHATDYQRPEALAQMVDDHFILLKAGPCLTFAFRQAVYALAAIEARWPAIGQPSNLRQVMDDLMRAHPQHWRHHYHGSDAVLDFLRHYSYRDRIRYYWPRPEAVRALDQMIRNLSGAIPDALLSEFFPDLYPDICRGSLSADPRSLIGRRIQNALAPYADACGPPALEAKN
jgi:D-tagatose-1,6-bisphosphate aldolase subunit GatZ/KbaZ